jgi:adenylate cyclase
LKEAARLLGHATAVPDGDGQVRRIPLFVMDGDQPLPAMGLAAYLQYLRFPVDVVEVEPGAVKFANRTLYTDSIGRMLIAYFGPPSKAYQPSTFPVYSYVDVVEGRVPADAFANKIVLIGALGASAEPDSYATPSTSTGAKMFGVEIHANIIETIHQSLAVPGVPHRARVSIDLGPVRFGTYEGTIQLPLREQSLNDKIAITVGLALLAGMLLPFLRWYVGLPLVLIGYWAYYKWASVTFQIDGRKVELLFPGLALGFTYMGILIVTYIFEERRRGQINDLFSRYVSAEIAQKIMEAFDRGQLELGGEEREITVLFADIRGFTTLSEGLDPPEVVRMLNIFLEQMTSIVMEHGGAINKYIGDNLMAFWNAPYPQEDHAWRATQTALEILAAIHALNQTDQFPVPVQFGIGINTGPVVVGNIGSARRLEYTPIGDTVNVASRLCGIVDGGSCYVGARTWELIGARVEPVTVHRLQVKGKAEPLKVYELKPALDRLRSGSGE